jgi:hypothetical protein
MKYKFLKKRDLNTAEIIKRFNYQIEEEIKEEIIKENCKSYWEKKLFIETLNFSLNDWEEIRVGDYFEIKDSLSGIDQNKFILSRVMKYVLSKELTIILEK